MNSLLSIDLGFDPRIQGMLIRLDNWRDGVRYHPQRKSCLSESECRTQCIETMAETLAKAGYSIVIAETTSGREVQCTPQELAPPGDRPGYTWRGPAWAVQAKNDNYWCIGPSLFAAIGRAGWRPDEIRELTNDTTTTAAP